METFSRALVLVAWAMLFWAAPARGQTEAAPADWPQLQHDAGRTGYTDQTVAFDRARKGGPAIFDLAWRWEKPAEISPLVQPIVAGGFVYVGDYDGTLHAIDAETGKTRWTYKTGGLIYHTACAHAGLAITGSQDGTLYAVDAAKGELKWKFATAAGIVTAPCAIGETVYTTSKDGRLYAVAVQTGKLLWQFPKAGEKPLAPIFCSPASGAGIVTFADESLVAYGVDAGTGELKWKAPLKGQSMMYFWPVVGAKTGIVVYRTQPIYPFHENLNRFDGFFERLMGMNRKQHDAAREADKSNTWAESHREDVRKEQDAIREYLKKNPWDQTCFVLGLADGKEKYIPPVAYTGGGGYTPAPPVLDDAGGRGWMIFRSGYSMADGGYMVRGYTDVGNWDPATGNITQISKPKQGWETYHLIGDEMVLLSANKDLLFLCTWPNNGAIGLEGNDSFNVTREEKLQVSHERESLWEVNAGSASGNGGGHGEATVVTAEGKIFWNSPRYIAANKARAK